MKFFTFLFFNLLFSVIVDAQMVSKDLVSTERIYDFGKIMEKDGKVSHTFVFRNIGKRSVVINDISAWCGCTSYTFTKTPIKPGATGKVRITYNPYNRPGFFSKEVVILTDGGRCYNRIWVKGIVVPYLHPVTEDYPYAFRNGLYFNLKVIAFGFLKKGETKTIELRCANDTDRPMNLTFVSEPGKTNLSYSRLTKLASKSRSKIQISYRAPQSYRFNRIIRLYPVVNGKRLDIPLMVTFAGI